MEDYSDRLLDLDPDSPSALFNKGLVQLADKKTKEAEAFFEKALEKNPDYVPALRQLTRIRLMEKDTDGAIKRCRQQIEKSPENSRYYVLLGGLYSIEKGLRLCS